MTEPIFELFLNPSSMVAAEIELVSRGEDAIPILESLFSGQAKNRFGVPYSQLGMPIECAVHVAARLGSIAKPLERYLRVELSKGNHFAAWALGSIGTLEQESISELAASLTGGLDLSDASAAALVRCGQTKNAAVLDEISKAEAAAKALERAESSLASRSGQ